MNTSSDSVGSTLVGSSVPGYVSCIKVDGRPILPPIMNESIRAEMRRYRDLAVRVESMRLKKRKNPRSSIFPLNTTVTLESSDLSESSVSSSDVESPSMRMKESGSVSMNQTERTMAGGSYDDHFQIKKSVNNEDVLSCIEEVSERSGASSSRSELKRSETYTKTPEDLLLGKLKQDEVDHPVTDDDDHNSEAMSLVSVEDKFQRDEIEQGDESDFSVENYPPDGRSGRSSTETFIIERHQTSDAENNNKDEDEVFNEPRYFFSPAREDVNSSIIFNAEQAPNTVKSRKYFQSPTSPRDVHLSEVSMVTSVSSVSSTTTAETGSNSSAQDYSANSFLTPRSSNSNTSKPSVARKFYFSSPETSPPQASARSDVDTVASQLSEASISVSLPISTPPPKPLTPTNTNVMPEGLKSPVRRMDTSPIIYAATKIPGRVATLVSSPVKCRSESPETFVGPNSTFTKKTWSPRKENIVHNGNTTPAFIGVGVTIHKTPVQPTPEAKALSAPAKSSTSTRSTTQSTSTGPQSPVKTASSVGQSQILGRVNLSTLQTAMMNLSPNVFRNPPDARSPLLKGLMCYDPIFRPKRELRIPPQALDPAMQPKFERVSAAAKGYLVRRLLRTEKLQMIIQTIRDTVELVLKLYEEVPQLKIRGWKGVKPEDADLCRRLFQQLTGACSSFHDVFFKLTTPQRMAIIANDREKLRAKELKSYLSRSQSVRGPRSRNAGRNGGPNSKRKISAATAKCLQRRMSVLT